MIFFSGMKGYNLVKQCFLVYIHTHIKENSGQQFQADITTLVGVCLDSPQISSGTGCWRGCISPPSPGPPCSCPRRPCTLPADWPMKAAVWKRTREKELGNIPHH